MEAMQIGANPIEIGNTSKSPDFDVRRITCEALDELSPDSTGSSKEK
jgi:hypothetical protein